MGVAIIGQEGAIIGEARVGVAITGQEGAIIGEAGVGVATTGQEGAIIGEVEVGVVMVEDEADTTQIGKGMAVTTDGRGKEGEEEEEGVTRGNPKEALIGALGITKQTIGEEAEQINLIITEWEEEGEIMFSFVVYNKKWTQEKIILELQHLPCELINS